ncbi:MAG: response regulator [Candidatus Nealsonbacteria bacterium]|nr:response regulator [Candidatus Nealsonbacteria bacterium]
MPRLLIVEDETLLAEMYRDSFRAAGFQVVSAPSVEDALKEVARKSPDLIVLDVLLLDENGLSLIEKIRKEKKDIPFLVLSNYDDPQTIKKAFELGSKEYLLKTDFTSSELVQEVKKYL